MTERLESGITVADVGCGAGGALLLMAAQYPQSDFHGYDISRYAISRAQVKAAEAGLDNVRFHDAAKEPLPSDHSVGFITTFDCIHDMTHPFEMLQALRRAISSDGTWLLFDIKARDTFALNASKNPMAPLMYGIGVLSCMSSGLSTADGAGLGTLGLPASKAEAMAREAGFGSLNGFRSTTPPTPFSRSDPDGTGAGLHDDVHSWSKAAHPTPVLGDAGAVGRLGRVPTRPAAAHPVVKVATQHLGDERRAWRAVRDRESARRAKRVRSSVTFRFFGQRSERAVLSIAWTGDSAPAFDGAPVAATAADMRSTHHIVVDVAGERRSRSVALQGEVDEVRHVVHNEMLGALAGEFDAVHTSRRFPSCRMSITTRRGPPSRRSG